MLFPELPALRAGQNYYVKFRLDFQVLEMVAGFLSLDRMPGIGAGDPELILSLREASPPAVAGPILSIAQVIEMRATDAPQRAPVVLSEPEPHSII